MAIEDNILRRLEAKFWDFPTIIDEMRVISYDANDNPLVIDYYWGTKLMFTHEITYDGSGRITIKKLIRR